MRDGGRVLGNRLKMLEGPNIDYLFVETGQSNEHRVTLSGGIRVDCKLVGSVYNRVRTRELLMPRAITCFISTTGVKWRLRLMSGHGDEVRYSSVGKTLCASLVLAMVRLHIYSGSPKLSNIV